MIKEEIINSEEVRLAIFLKINQIRREQLKSLRYSHIIQMLFRFVWNNSLPKNLNEAINDIMNLNANEIVASLHTLALIDGSQMSMDKIEDIIGGIYNG